MNEEEEAVKAAELEGGVGVGGIWRMEREKKRQKDEQWMHIIYSAVFHQTRIYNWNDKEDASPSQWLVLEAMNFRPRSWHLLYPHSVNHQGLTWDWVGKEGSQEGQVEVL